MKKTLKRLVRRIRGNPAKSEFQRLGDAARDNHDWTLAAALYAKHLQRAPTDFGIHVQYGHMLKEAGRLDDAAEAYATAGKLRDDDADLMLSRGHLSKMQGNIGAALGFYHLSHAIDGNIHAANELTANNETLVHATTAGPIDQLHTLDAHFYWELYLSEKPFNARDVTAHYRDILSNIDNEQSDACNTQNSRPFANLNALLAAYDMTPGRWLDLFSPREFCLSGFDWIGSQLNRSQAIALFLREGIERLAPISFAHRFDANFYIESHVHLAGSTPVEAYRAWLLQGLQHNEAGTVEAWLRAHGLDLIEFPEALHWQKLDSARQGGASKWQALLALINDQSQSPAGWPLATDDAADFLLAVGTRHQAQGRIEQAIKCYKQALRAENPPQDTYLFLGDAYHTQQEWKSAVNFYQKFHSLGNKTLWSICLCADAMLHLNQFEDAFEVLKVGKPSFSGEQPWINGVQKSVNARFDYQSQQARTLYSDDQRDSADEIMMKAVEDAKRSILELVDLPAATHNLGRGPVITLGTSSLRQCTYYRIEQKEYFFEEIGVESKFVEYTNVEDFIAALPGASAAIFYRIPAFPGVIQAITSAKNQKIPTYYETDDLIFDVKNYPDTFESFQGLISEDLYLGLLFGTTLYHSAMALCDYGIASTTQLAVEMEKVVESGRCFVVKNGLDPRNLGLGSLPSKPVRADGKVRIVYGSATLSHNQDFHDLAGPGLCAILAQNPLVELVIIGHLALEPMFDPYMAQIKQISLLSDTRSYWTLLATCDINLAVLTPSLMSDCKSEIKWLEAAIVGLPSIVSKTATYREVVDHGRTGLIAATPDEWTTCLKRLVDDADLRRKMAGAAREQVLKEYSLENGAHALDVALRASSSSTAGANTARKPRILLVNVYFAPQSIGGGTRVVMGNIDDYLDSGAQNDFEFAIVASDLDASPAYRRRSDSYRGIPVYRIAPPMVGELDWSYEDPKIGEWFGEILRQFQPDLVHFHAIQRLTASIAEACSSANIPYMMSVHDGWWLSDYQFMFDEKSRPRTPGDELILGGKPGIPLNVTIARLAFLRQALDGAQVILAPSESFAATYRDAGFSKTKTVSNGVPDLTLLPRVPSQTGRVRLGHIGDTSPHKGFDLVEAALRQGHFPNLELLALSHARHGDQESREIWGESLVRIRGRVPQDRVANIYAELDVLLAPSACQESYGLVTREANAAGLWVVASNRGGIGDDVREGVDGFVIDVSTPEDLLQTLKTINDNPERYLKPAPRNPAVQAAGAQAAEILREYSAVLQNLKSAMTPASKGRQRTATA